MLYPRKHFDTSGKSPAPFHRRAICKTAHGNAHRALGEITGQIQLSLNAKIFRLTTNVSQTIGKQFNIPALQLHCFGIQFFAVSRASKWQFKRACLVRFSNNRPIAQGLNSDVCSFVQGDLFYRIHHLIASVHRVLLHAQFNFCAHLIHSVRR
jgi:hypothetical protein